MYGVRRTGCPKCGGRIIISEMCQYSRDYFVTKTGKVSKKYTIVDNGGLDVSIATCENVNNQCGVFWEATEFDIDEYDRFVDYKYK